MRSPEIEAIAKRAREHHNGVAGFANEGLINVYHCVGPYLGIDMKNEPGISAAMVKRGPACGREIVTIDREPGVTPFGGPKCECGGDTQSSGYRVRQDLVPSHEWYRPDSLEDLSDWARDHVRNGGLLLRPIDHAKVEALKSEKLAAEAGSKHAHRDPAWRRFTGDIALVALTSGNTPTVGIGADECDDCGTRRVLIACISDAGHECNVGVDPQTALAIAEEIRQRALLLLPEGGKA